MKIKNLKKANATFLSIKGSERFLFVPALFFVAVGILAALAPRLILALIASFFLFIGIIAAFIAWKFIQVRRKFDGMVKDLNGKVFIRSSAEQHPFDFEEDVVVEQDKKKILYH